MNDDVDIGRLLVQCPDRPGIVAAMAGFLSTRQANIIESQQHSTDPFGGVFYLRMEFHLPGLASKLADLASDFAELAGDFEMQWRVTHAAEVKKVAIFVSKTDHALQEILWRRHAGDLRADIVMVISNHPDLAESARSWGVPFHHIPIAAGSRDAGEARQLEILGTEIDLIVLARYMQVLSPSFVARFPARIINIHHSFLPAFVGANPYAAAYERGVKLIGATAHYVTDDLDAGPIIEQEVQRVDHAHSIDDLRRVGRYVERAVLARAVTWHVDDRVLVHGNKTVVFD